jgi:hypothetical protein
VLNNAKRAPSKIWQLLSIEIVIGDCNWGCKLRF